jgi:hypothetical protein
VRYLKQALRNDDNGALGGEAGCHRQPVPLREFLLTQTVPKTDAGEVIKPGLIMAE